MVNDRWSTATILTGPYCRRILQGASCLILSLAHCIGVHDVLLWRKWLLSAPLEQTYSLLSPPAVEDPASWPPLDCEKCWQPSGPFTAEFACPMYPQRGQHFPPHHCRPAPACRGGGCNKVALPEPKVLPPCILLTSGYTLHILQADGSTHYK